MTANELADFILDTVDRIKESTPDELPHIIEGAVYRLTLESDNEWEVYKTYCAWTGQDRTSGESLFKFYKIIDKIEEANDGLNHIKNRSRTIS